MKTFLYTVAVLVPCLIGVARRDGTLLEPTFPPADFWGVRIVNP